MILSVIFWVDRYLRWLFKQRKFMFHFSIDEMEKRVGIPDLIVKRWFIMVYSIYLLANCELQIKNKWWASLEKLYKSWDVIQFCGIYSELFSVTRTSRRTKDDADLSRVRSTVFILFSNEIRKWNYFIHLFAFSKRCYSINWTAELRTLEIILFDVCENQWWMVVLVGIATRDWQMSTHWVRQSNLLYDKVQQEKKITPQVMNRLQKFP